MLYGDPVSKGETSTQLWIDSVEYTRHFLTYEQQCDAATDEITVTPGGSWVEYSKGIRPARLQDKWLTAFKVFNYWEAA
jgi:hypothetical protein